MPVSSNRDNKPTKVSDEQVSGFINAAPGTYPPEVQKEHLDTAKSRGLISRYGQTTVMIREFDSQKSGPHTGAEIKKRFKSGDLTEKTLVYVEDIQGWLTLPEVFDVRKWRTRSISIFDVDDETGRRSSDSRLEPEPIRKLATQMLAYPEL